jgi:NDP-sugar pyrophosphorylase family protein
MSRIKGGIIAAGHGTRFKENGVETHKALLNVAGKPLLAWTLSQFIDVGVEDITIIFNEFNAPECTNYLRENYPNLHVKVIVKTTASSFESFCEVSRKIGSFPRLITAIDSIYQRGKLRELLQAAKTYPADAMVLGVTSFIDDEKPLYVEMGPDRSILALGDKKTACVTSGAYWMPPLALPSAEKFSALRQFLIGVVESGAPAYGFDMGKSVDVDRPGDIKAAEEFLATFR